MKKFIIILALMATGISANAQVQFDTLSIGDREPTFYYWDTNWWDHYYLNYPEAQSSNVFWYQSSLTTMNLGSEYARYCYTDTSLRIIGIAAGLSLGGSVIDSVWDQWATFGNASIDTVQIYKYMQPEYFRLYEVDAGTGNMKQLASASWFGFQPRYKMVSEMTNQVIIGAGGSVPVPPEYCSVYEAYFDSAITVHDSFYVSATEFNCHNNARVMAGLVGIHAQSFVKPDPVTGANVAFHPEFFPKPNHFRRKLHTMPPAGGDPLFYATDTAWHTYDIQVRHLTWPQLDTVYRWPYFMYIFPIVDTSSNGGLAQNECSAPEGLTLVDIDSGSVILSWQGGGADLWELSIGTVGSTPETGTVTTCNNELATVGGLDTAQWYAARVRSVCNFGDSSYYSDWSDSVMFYVPGDTTGNGGGDNPNRIETTADRYTYLMPNPASETVTVASSFRIGDVEVYTLDGRRILASRVDGISTTLDISSLPTGTYIVRVSTNNGTAYKKLVVK